MADALTSWRLLNHIDDVRVCTSELATNALKYGTLEALDARSFDVRVIASDSLLRVEVHDPGIGIPRELDASEDDNSGRGLLLVRQLADAWGVDLESDHGKTVWAEFKLTDPAQQVTASRKPYTRCAHPSAKEGIPC